MIKPGPTGDYGACGIGRTGMDATYSAALWRDNPTAFWLHPEGPLADSTPGEFFKSAPAPVVLDARRYAQEWQNAAYAQNVGYWQLNGLQNAYAYQDAMQGIHSRYAGTRGLFGGLL